MASRADPRLQLVFDESLRALEQQAARRDDLRNRAGALVAAAAIATAFLGSQSVPDGGVFGGWVWLAVASFALIIGLSIYVLAPRRRWIFVTSAQRLLADYVEADAPASLDDMHRELALHFEDDFDSNAEVLDRSTLAVQATCVLLAVEIAAWLFALQGRR